MTNRFPLKVAEKIGQLIQTHQRFILTTHINPDGDALGSEMAVYWHLKSLKKQVWIFNQNAVSQNYCFLDPQKVIQVFDPCKHEAILRQAEVCFVLDIADWQRLHKLAKWLHNDSIVKVCIDHHPIENQLGDINIILPEASSTGEILYRLFKQLKVPITIQMAQAFYTAIMTDTGCFRFSNTSAATHRMAAELLELGVIPSAIYQKIYEQDSPGKIWLLGQVLSNLQFECDGRIVWFKITEAMLRQAGISRQELEEFTDFPRRIKGVEISVLFLEQGTDHTKVSFRSKGTIPINDVARELGGGGHPFAAGAVVGMPMDKAIPSTLQKLRSVFSLS